MKDTPIQTLRWRCRRGMLELELLLTPFLDHQYSSLSFPHQQDFINLLTLPDPDLYNYLIGALLAPPEFKLIVEKIRDYHHHQS